MHIGPQLMVLLNSQAILTLNRTNIVHQFNFPRDLTVSFMHQRQHFPWLHTIIHLKFKQKAKMKAMPQASTGPPGPPGLPSWAY